MTHDDLIQEMLDTLDGLGYVQSARIDARVWAKFYRRKYRGLLRRVSRTSIGGDLNAPHTPPRARRANRRQGAN